MKLSDFKKEISHLEVAILAIFVIYLILPIQTPDFVFEKINSPVGILGIFVVIAFLFMFKHPVLGIIFLFVVYELFRRGESETMSTAYVSMNMNEYSTNKPPVLNNQSIKFSKNQLDNLEKGTTSTLNASFGKPNVPENYLMTPLPRSNESSQTYYHQPLGLPQYRSTDEIINDDTETMEEKNKEEYLNSINPKPNEITLEEEIVQNKLDELYDWNAGAGENTKISSTYSNSTLSMGNV